MESLQNQIINNSAELKELELNSLLEITQAINNNLPEDSLYKIYKFTLMANLKIDRMALYMYDKDWQSNVYFGLEDGQWPQELPAVLKSQREITFVDDSIPELKGFDVAIPVLHKTNLLSYVLLGGMYLHTEKVEIEKHLNFIKAITNILVVAIENKRLARERLKQEALNKEIEIAKNVQTLLLPEVLPSFPYFEVNAHYIPNRLVGGDYYDCIALRNDLILFCVADVSGKGVPAAILMSNFQAALRTLTRQNISLEDLVHELNLQICHSARKENFITLFVGVFDLKSKQLRYINAGHNKPLLVDHHGQLHLLDKGTTILGMFDPLPFIEKGVVPLSGVSTLVMYTDGLNETFNEQQEMFGEERLNEIVNSSFGQSPEQLNQQILSNVKDFKGALEFGDDVTLLSCKLNV